MPVTPEVRAILRASETAIQWSEPSPAELRRAFSAFTTVGTREEVGSVVDRTIPGPACSTTDCKIRMFAW